MTTSKKPTSTKSKKAKGRKLQQWIRDLIIKVFHLKEGDVYSKTMGEGGEDILFSPKARSYFPYSVEAKNQERINVWEAYRQALANAGEYEPLVIIKKNHFRELAVLSAEHFIEKSNVMNIKGCISCEAIFNQEEFVCPECGSEKVVSVEEAFHSTFKRFRVQEDEPFLDDIKIEEELQYLHEGVLDDVVE